MKIIPIAASRIVDPNMLFVCYQALGMFCFAKILTWIMASAGPVKYFFLRVRIILTEICLPGRRKSFEDLVHHTLVLNYVVILVDLLANRFSRGGGQHPAKW